MIAVISELWPYPDRQSDYVSLAAELHPLLESIDGFISAERFESCQERGKFLSFSLWRDDVPLAHWRNLEKHRLIMDYSLKGRSEAPADSRALFG